MHIRLAVADDMAAVNDIRNHTVRTSTAIYTSQETTLAERLHWLRERGARLHPVTVAVGDDDRVVGWASLSPYNEKCGYQATVENSVYVHPEHLGRGIGDRLLADILDRGKAGGAHLVIARIDSEQTPSLRLHEKHGFTLVGRLHQAGRKFDRWLDVIYLQKLL